MAAFENLVDFATEDVIYRLIAKERGKYAAKNGGKKNPFASDPLYQEVRGMTPPHKYWSNPGRGKLREKKEQTVIEQWTKRKRHASIRVYRAILNHHDQMPDAKWVQKLDVFVQDIKDTLSGKAPLSMDAPRILAKFKEQDSESGDFIFRPICQYSKLKTKILLALAYKYIVTYFDKYFHKDMLFVRAARRIDKDTYSVPKYLDAIDMVCAYRKKHDGQSIFVGECDIQKFYDIFNHDVVEACFEDLFEEVKQREGVADSAFDPLRRVIRAYLESFNYPEHVMGKNDDPSFWKGEIRRRKKNTPNPVCRFKWVKEDTFISSGCYTAEEFQSAKKNGKLGIPQGGALSCVIVNVVMRVVDKPIVEPLDSDRLFIRYCDDILLMHTNRTSCESYLDTYFSQLIKCKLIPHPRKDVSDFKSGRKTGAGFWHSKSKNVYLWGPGCGDASDWIAFLGYEMRRTGEIRVRKDKIDMEFKRIAKRYFDIIYSKAVKSGEPLSEEKKAQAMERMDSLAGHILNYQKAGNNIYTRSQARRLDKYLYRKSRLAAKKLGIADTKQAARERTTYLQKIQEKDA